MLEKGFPRIHVTVDRDGNYVDDYGNKDSKEEEEKKDN